MTDLENYDIQGDPEQKERGYIWHTAIGLQKVDGLTPSDYLISVANKNINGDISLKEARELIESYYIAHPAKTDDEKQKEEADKVSDRITEILAEMTFSFSPAEYITIHRRLFDGIYRFAGKIRDYNITKKEWVLGGKTVYYASAESIRDTLDYDFNQEKAFSYKGLSIPQTAEHIAKFISGIWQIHAFGEGNTRTTAVFAIKYLRTFGFDVTNDIFAANAWYFRNALVRANFNDLQAGIHATQEYLDRFFANLLLGEKNELKNRELLAKPMTDVAAKQENDTDVVDGVVDNVVEVLTLLRKTPSMTTKQISTSLSMSERQVQRIIKKLKDSNKIRRVGSDRTGHWEIL